jgi:excisionase family DNA binding protein
VSNLPNSNLGDELQAATVTVVEHLLARVGGRPVSPRIRLLDIDQVCEATGLGKSTIYEMIERGTFPKPQQGLGARCNRWREQALIDWAERNDPNVIKKAG